MNKKTASLFPSVTTICCMHIDKSFFPAGCAERGSKVHLWANHFLNGIWSPFLEEEHPNYIEGLKTWLEKYEARLIFGEGRLENNQLGFNGHPDFIGTINSEEGIGLIDFKTSNSVQPWWKIQLAAYLNLAEANEDKVGYSKIYWAASLSVDKRGDVTFKKYTREEMKKEAFTKFMNLLRYYKNVYTLDKIEDNEFCKHVVKYGKKHNYSNEKMLSNYIRYSIYNRNSYFEGVKGA